MWQRGLEDKPRILVVDDEVGARESLEVILEDQYAIDSAEDGASALEKIRSEAFDLVLLDIAMPKVNGIEVLKRIKCLDSSIDVIMVSGTDRAHEAATSMKCGAFDYITKPYGPEDILETVERVIRKRSLEHAVRPEPRGVGFRFEDSQIVSQSRAMHGVFEIIEKVATASSSVLITGESGTGKELIARAIHARSPRSQKPFVPINCAAIPPELIESELFGHEKGAFTGAHVRNIGKFEYANGGTIFLDEISSLRLEFQAKLLRLLQEREFCRVGSHRTMKVDVRIVAATNTRLEDLVKEKLFRSDLYFRLKVVPVDLPALRDRKGDVPLLANHFLAKFNRVLGKNVFGIRPDTMDVLEAYPWPGNVRELENLVERLVVLGRNNAWIEEGDLPFEQFIRDEDPPHGDPGGLIGARQSFEREYILRALRRCRWNQTDTAKLLKIHRNTLIQKMKSLNVRVQLED